MAAPLSPRPPNAQSGGDDAPLSVFVDTDLGTRFALAITPDTTIRCLKSQVAAEHAVAYPDIGPVAVKSFQISQEGGLYHLSESMTVRLAFPSIKAGYFLHVKMEDINKSSKDRKKKKRRARRSNKRKRIALHHSEASMDTGNKEIIWHTENEGKTDKVYAERENLHVPFVGATSDNVQEGDLDVIENPNGDGKQKKKKRHQSESLRVAGPNQDQTKSLEHVQNIDSNHLIGDAITSTAEVAASGEKIVEESFGPWAGCEKHEETKQQKYNEGSHDEDVPAASDLNDVFTGDSVEQGGNQSKSTKTQRKKVLTDKTTQSFDEQVNQVAREDIERVSAFMQEDLVTGGSVNDIAVEAIAKVQQKGKRASKSEACKIQAPNHSIHTAQDSQDENAIGFIGALSDEHESGYPTELSVVQNDSATLNSSNPNAQKERKKQMKTELRCHNEDQIMGTKNKKNGTGTTEPKEFQKSISQKKVPGSNIVTRLAMSPEASSYSIAGRSQIADKFRSILRDISDESDDSVGTNVKKSAIKGFSSAHANSGTSPATDDESDLDDEALSLSKERFKGMNVRDILRGSNAYKEAKQQYDELPDDEIFIFDSLPATGR